MTTTESSKSDDFFCECCGRDYFQGADKMIIIELLKQEPLTGSQLSKRIGVSDAAISKRLKILDALSYIRIERNPYSRNIKMISIDPDFRPKLIPRTPAKVISK
jgi:DNA-binding MarR family transcriptional regulator